jgi:hypothetical protein
LAWNIYRDVILKARLRVNFRQRPGGKTISLIKIWEKRKRRTKKEQETNGNSNRAAIGDRGTAGGRRMSVSKTLRELPAVVRYSILSVFLLGPLLALMLLTLFSGDGFSQDNVRTYARHRTHRKSILK